VVIHVNNASAGEIRDVIFSWSGWNAPKTDRIPYLDTGKQDVKERKFPDNLQASDDKDAFTAVVYFRDAKKVNWCATPDGDLAEGSPPK
jgi:hypothetical protein